MVEYFDILREDGREHASSKSAVITAEGGKVFMRRAFHLNHPTKPPEECWAVGELDGVRAYVQKNNGRVNVILTKRDLWP